MPPSKGAKILKQEASAKTSAPTSLASETTGPPSPSPAEPAAKTPAKALSSAHELTTPMTRSKSTAQIDTPQASGSSITLDTPFLTQSNTIPTTSPFDYDDFRAITGKKRKEPATDDHADLRPSKAKAPDNGNAENAAADDFTEVLMSPATSKGPAICTDNFADFYKQ
ncbi:hypothetical protein BC835DRAFT_1424700 [Cytidiella melzeri]|nr:hypothetical protein BC835DRAFT_1424700 [Cytidiella melzeri]